MSEAVWQAASNRRMQVTSMLTSVEADMERLSEELKKLEGRKVKLILEIEELTTWLTENEDA